MSQQHKVFARIHAQRFSFGVELDAIRLLVESGPGVVATAAHLQRERSVGRADCRVAFEPKIVDVVGGGDILVARGDFVARVGVDEHHRQRARIAVGAHLRQFPRALRPIVAACWGVDGAHNDLGIGGGSAIFASGVADVVFESGECVGNHAVGQGCGSEGVAIHVVNRFGESDFPDVAFVRCHRHNVRFIAVVATVNKFHLAVFRERVVEIERAGRDAHGEGLSCAQKCGYHYAKASHNVWRCFCICRY